MSSLKIGACGEKPGTKSSESLSWDGSIVGFSFSVVLPVSIRAQVVTFILKIILLVF